MRTTSLVRLRQVLRHPAPIVLAALAIAAVLGAGGRVAHLHEDGTPGYYNAQHVLDGLAALSGDAPLPDAPASAAPGALATRAALAVAAAAAPLAAAPADSRAPPSV